MHQIESLTTQTVEQSGSILWKDARKLRLTASCTHKVPVKEDTDPKKFLSEHLHPSFLGNSNTRHGIQSEFSVKNFLKSQGYSLRNVGMYVSTEEKWLSASPDGIIDNDTLLEIKCPVPGVKWQTLDDLITSKKYDVFYNNVNGRYELKVNGSRGFFNASSIDNVLLRLEKVYSDYLG